MEELNDFQAVALQNELKAVLAKHGNAGKRFAFISIIGSSNIAGGITIQAITVGSPSPVPDVAMYRMMLAQACEMTKERPDATNAYPMTTGRKH